MKILIETQFLPPVEVFAFLSRADEIHIEQHEHYQKRSFRNRCHLLGSSGLLAFSIPLKKGKNQQQSIRKTEVSYQSDWVRIFRQQLQSSYGKSPFLAFYADGIFSILEERPDSLFELNLSLFHYILKVLGWTNILSYTNEYRDHWPDSEDYCDLRNVFSPLAKQKIVVPEPAYSYPQVFESRFGFVPYLSILDLICNLGPESGVWLKALPFPLPCKNHLSA